MRGYLIRRSIMAIVTIIGTVILTWFLLELSPENAIGTIISVLIGSQSSVGTGAGAAAEAQNLIELRHLIEAYANSLKPHGNPVTQALLYLWNFLHGNLGVSILNYTPVATEIAVTLPWTLFIVVPSTILGFLIGVRIGEKIGYKRGSVTDSILSMFFTVLRAIPVYVLGSLLLFFLGFELRIFPVLGAYSPDLKPSLSLEFITNVLYHAILPILTLTLVNTAGWVLSMRANVIYTLGEDYVTFAEIRGVPDGRIESRYVGRNSILPLYTGLLIALGFSFSGTVFIEQIFTYPGIGNLLNNAVANNDYPTEMGILVIIVLAVVIGMLLADLTYSLLDPRVRQE